MYTQKSMLLSLLLKIKLKKKEFLCKPVFIYFFINLLYFFFK